MVKTPWAFTGIVSPILEHLTRDPRWGAPRSWSSTQGLGEHLGCPLTRPMPSTPWQARWIKGSVSIQWSTSSCWASPLPEDDAHHSGEAATGAR